MKYNEEDVKNRIKELLADKTIAQMLEMSDLEQKSAFDEQIYGNKTLSCDTLLFILERFEDLQAEWLMRGEGLVTISYEKYLNKDSEKTIAYLYKAIEVLWNRLKDLQNKEEENT